MSSSTNPQDVTPNFTQSDIDQNKVMAVLSYLGIFVLIPIFAAKESPFARFHASQGLSLLLCQLINVVLAVILCFIPILGILWLIVAWLIGVAFFVLAILGIVNAAQGKAKALPIVGKIRILK